MATRFGPFELDVDLGTLRGPEGEVRLRPKTYRLLTVLVDRAPAVVSKDELQDLVWGPRHLGTTSLAQAIGELRRALGEDPRQPRFVETVHGRGYRFHPHPLARVADPGTVAESSVPESRRFPARGALLLPLVLMTALVLGWLWSRTQSVSPPVGPVAKLRLAVLAPESSTRTAPLWLRKVMPELLASRLRRHSGIFTYSRERLARMARDLGTGTVPIEESARSLAQARYLQAERLITWQLGMPTGERWPVELAVVDRQGTELLRSATLPLRPAELGRAVEQWEGEVLRACGLSPPRQRGRRRQAEPSMKALGLYFEALDLAEKEPRQALRRLERAQRMRPKSYLMARARAEILLAQDGLEAALPVALEARTKSPRIEEEVWFLRLSGRAHEAMPLLAKGAGGEIASAELWLELLTDLWLQQGSGALLEALDALPPAVAGSWVGPELRLLEARAAREAGESARARRSAIEARRLAEDLGHRQVREQAAALLEASAQSGP